MRGGKYACYLTTNVVFLKNAVKPIKRKANTAKNVLKKTENYISVGLLLIYSIFLFENAGRLFILRCSTSITLRGV